MTVSHEGVDARERRVERRHDFRGRDEEPEAFGQERRTALGPRKGDRDRSGLGHGEQPVRDAVAVVMSGRGARRRVVGGEGDDGADRGGLPREVIAEVRHGAEPTAGGAG